MIALSPATATEPNFAVHRTGARVARPPAGDRGRYAAFDAARAFHAR